NAVDALDAKLAQHVFGLVEAAVNQGDGQVAKNGTRQVEHGGVAIQADDPGRRSDARGQQSRVSARADRGVYQDLPRLRRQVMNHLLRHHRHMTRLRSVDGVAHGPRKGKVASSPLWPTAILRLSSPQRKQACACLRCGLEILKPSPEGGFSGVALGGTPDSSNTRLGA